MRSAARGLEYLHANGVLHRDIKPDNVLVFSLDEVISVNGKLTDFGSSRNINMLMTNMTFTKGVGSPTYMAPQVLNKEKYKKTADVYLFGVTMYECFMWGDGPEDALLVPMANLDVCPEREAFQKPTEMVNVVYSVVQRFLNMTPWALLGLSSMTGTTLGFCFNLL